jgi:prepilin-type N-terminal cleavage/methylation domain-containing protein
MQQHLQRPANTASRVHFRTRAFSLTELLVVLAIIVVVACLLLPSGHGNRQRASRVACTSNLHRINVATTTWALDNKGFFPWQVLTNESGKLKPEAATNASLLFVILSNQLSTPHILKCPADRQRAAISSFAKLANTNISYFIGLDSTEATRRRSSPGTEISPMVWL